jgi:hypothetical protein
MIYPRKLTKNPAYLPKTQCPDLPEKAVLIAKDSELADDLLRIYALFQQCLGSEHLSEMKSKGSDDSKLRRPVHHEHISQSFHSRIGAAIRNGIDHRKRSEHPIMTDESFDIS